MSTDAEGTARLQDTVEAHYNQVHHNIAHGTAIGKMLKPGLNLSHIYHFLLNSTNVKTQWCKNSYSWEKAGSMITLLAPLRFN